MVEVVTVDAVVCEVESVLSGVVGADVVVVGVIVVEGDVAGVREVGAGSLCDIAEEENVTVGAPVFTVVGLVLTVMEIVVEPAFTVVTLVIALVGVVEPGGGAPLLPGGVTVSIGADVASAPVGAEVSSVGVGSTAILGIYGCPGAM